MFLSNLLRQLLLDLLIDNFIYRVILNKRLSLKYQILERILRFFLLQNFALSLGFKL